MVEAILNALQTDVDSPRGSDANAFGGSPGQPAARGHGGLHRKPGDAHGSQAELAAAYPGTGIGGQLTLPPAAIGPHALGGDTGFDDGTQANAMWRSAGVPGSGDSYVAGDALGSMEGTSYDGLTLDDLPAEMRDKLLQGSGSADDESPRGLYDALGGGLDYLGRCRSRPRPPHACRMPHARRVSHPHQSSAVLALVRHPLVCCPPQTSAATHHLLTTDPCCCPCCRCR